METVKSNMVKLPRERNPNIWRPDRREKLFQQNNSKS